jgi:hypothetical protein
VTVIVAARGQIDDITEQLYKLLQQNEAAEPIDRLDRMEFCVDVAGRDSLQAEFARKASELQSTIAEVWRCCCCWQSR